jgi:hypothetical protein
MLVILILFTGNFRRTAGIIKKIGAMRTDQWISIKLIKYDDNIRAENPTVVTIGNIIDIE